MVQLAGELLVNAGAVAEDMADFPSRDFFSHDTMQLFGGRTASAVCRARARPSTEDL